MLSDFHFALRGFRRTPGLIAAAVLTMALATGANTAIFSVVESTLLRSLPYRDPARLAVLWEANPKVAGFLSLRLPVAGRNLAEWKNRLHSFQQIESLRRLSLTLTGIGKPENLDAARVTSGFFRLFGRGAALGRTFRAEEGDPGNDGAVVLSAAFFARTLHGDPHSLGGKLTLDGVPYIIAGVMPADFHLPALWQGREEIRPDVWLPAPAVLALPAAAESRCNYVFARLRDGVSFGSARAELSDLARQLEREYPRLDAGYAAGVFPLAVEDVAPAMRHTVLALEGAAIFVLLIACANIASLLLTRAAGCAREMAIRAALGASQVRILRAALAESLLIAAIGGALGLGLAYAAMAVIHRLAPEPAYRLHELSLNGRVLGAALAAVLFSALLFGLAPAAAASRVNLRAALSRNGGTGAGRGAGGVHGALAAAETALALILLAGAGLMIRSMANLFHVALGFNSAHVLTLRVHLPEGRYRNASQVREFCDRLLASSSALPGVRSAAISTSLPLMDSLSLTPYRLAGTPEPNPGQRTMADFKGVSEDYFRATGTALLRGRLFTAQDAAGESPQVAIINQALARQLSPGGGDPLGRALVVGAGAKTIVGIVAGSHQTGLDSPVRPEMFLPTRSIGKMTMILRTAGEPMAYAPAVSAAVWAIDPSQPVSNLRSLEEQVDRSATQRRFDTVLFNGFGALALLLAGLGIYGALAHSVALRKREMGVRMALGARPASVKALVFLGACKLTLWGFAAGVPLALALTRCMRSIVFGVSTADPATFAVTALLLFAVAALASYVPAARAARHNPLAAMRGE